MLLYVYFTDRIRCDRMSTGYEGGGLGQKGIEIKRGLGKKNWKKVKFTALLDGYHHSTLQNISDATGIPMSRIISQALDDFFKKIGLQEEPETPPIDTEFIANRVGVGHERTNTRE